MVKHSKIKIVIMTSTPMKRVKIKTVNGYPDHGMVRDDGRRVITILDDKAIIQNHRNMFCNV